jgi:hypothetical protein
MSKLYFYDTFSMIPHTLCSIGLWIVKSRYQAYKRIVLIWKSFLMRDPNTASVKNNTVMSYPDEQFMSRRTLILSEIFETLRVFQVWACCKKLRSNWSVPSNSTSSIIHLTHIKNLDYKLHYSFRFCPNKPVSTVCRNRNLAKQTKVTI